MNIQAWIQKFRCSLVMITWLGFVVIFGIFLWYALMLKEQEVRTEESLRREIKTLRQENSLLLELNQQLETRLFSECQVQAGQPTVDPGQTPRPEQNQRSFVYTVKRGDTIWDIAAFYNVDVRDLMRWNNLSPRSRIFPGDQLTIVVNSDE